MASARRLMRTADVSIDQPNFFDRSKYVLAAATDGAPIAMAILAVSCHHQCQLLGPQIGSWYGGVKMRVIPGTGRQRQAIRSEDLSGLALSSPLLSCAFLSSLRLVVHCMVRMKQKITSTNRLSSERGGLSRGSSDR